MNLLHYILLIFIFSNYLNAEIQLKRYSISTYTNTNQVETDVGQLGSNELATEVTSLTALRVLFRQYANPNLFSSSTISLENRLTLADNMESEIYGDPLIFPNPFKLTSSAILGYWLSQPDNIQIQIYDMFGHRVFDEIKMQGMLGARMGYNKVQINQETFDFYNISSGTYFLFIFDSANKLIGKTKFSIIP